MTTRHYLAMTDLSREETEALLARTTRLKADRALVRQGRLVPDRPLANRTLGMIFNKPSTRTRVSFQVGIHELGGQVVYMSERETQMARREPPSHTARVLSRYLDGLVIRTFDQTLLEELARHATIPIVNALTDQGHPCQVLSDLFTVIEKKGHLAGLKVAWIGDGNNMAHSWIEAAALMDFELTLAVPAGYDPDSGLLAAAQTRARRPIAVTRNPAQAADGADVVNTDVWASMGQEGQADDRARAFAPYQVNAALMAKAHPQAIVLHCLPAHPGEEITDEVLEGPQSVVFDQAENRLHAQKALLEFLLSRQG